MTSLPGRRSTRSSVLAAAFSSSWKNATLAAEVRNLQIDVNIRGWLSCGYQQMIYHAALAFEPESWTVILYLCLMHFCNMYARELKGYYTWVSIKPSIVFPTKPLHVIN